MKKFVRFQISEYMDEYPTENIQMWEGENEEEITSKCIEYANAMTKQYSGGPTSFIGIMSKEDAKKWLYNKITLEIEKYHNEEDTPKIIERMCRMYNESYK